MCGRFVQARPPHELAVFLDAVVDDTVSSSPARFNIAPSASVTVLDEVNERRVLASSIWGLIPSWAKDPSIGQKLSNARSETVWEKPSFKSAIRSSRVIVPVEGFYEWSPARKDGPRGSSGRPLKEPHYFSRQDGEPMLLAGISSRWQNPLDGSDQRSTVCLLTTSANKTMEPIHHRMPVILKTDDIEHWLTATKEDAETELSELLRPCADHVLHERVVSTDVNNARNEGVHLLDEVDDTPSTLF
jgi:putative SOS response-associated peptidase YedK